MEKTDMEIVTTANGADAIGPSPSTCEANQGNSSPKGPTQVEGPSGSGEATASEEGGAIEGGGEEMSLVPYPSADTYRARQKENVARLISELQRLADIPPERVARLRRLLEKADQQFIVDEELEFDRSGKDYADAAELIRKEFGEEIMRLLKRGFCGCEKNEKKNPCERMKEGNTQEFGEPGPSSKRMRLSFEREGMAGVVNDHEKDVENEEHGGGDSDDDTEDHPSTATDALMRLKGRRRMLAL